MLSRTIRGYILLVFAWLALSLAKQHQSVDLIYVASVLAAAAGIMFITDFFRR